MVNKLIPDHLLDALYQATNISPNNNVFTQNQLARLPIPVLGLDNIISWTSDCLQDTQNQINSIIAGQFGPNGNTNQFLVYTEPNVLGAVSLQDMLTTLGALNFDGSKINTGTIYGQSIRPLSIADQQIGNVSGVKVLPATIALSKLSLPTDQACIIGSTTTNGGSVYYQSLSPWLVATGRATDNGISAQTLDVIWANTANTFTGAKITPNTITGVQIAPNTITGVQIAPGSVPLSDLQSSGYLGVVCSSNNNYAYQEVSLGALQVITRTTGASSLTAQNLSTIFNNEDGHPYDGSQLQDGSVPPSKLAPDPTRAFAWGKIDGRGNVLNGYNIQSVDRNSAGKYTVKFLSAAPNNKYAIIMNAVNGDGSEFSHGYPYDETQTTGQFDVWTKKSGLYSDTGFYITVFSL